MRANNPISVAALAFLITACSAEPTPSDGEDSTVGARVPTPVGLHVDADCTAMFPQPKPGVRVRYALSSGGGQPIPVSMIDEVVDVRGDIVLVNQFMESLDGDRSPSGMPYERQRVVFWRSSGGSGDARREYSYDDPGLGEQLSSLQPGETIETQVRERTNFVPGGERVIEGLHSVTFLGCGDLDVAGQREAARVFRVQSIGRSYNHRAPAARREAVVHTENVIWISERTGWVLKDSTPEGDAVAEEIFVPS